MLHVFFYEMKQQMQVEKFQQYVGLLTPALQKKVSAFRHWQDAERSLAGNMLLLNGLETLSLQGWSLSQLKYTPFQKPYFQDGPSFNISHSGRYIVCVISNQYTCGIDVEEIKEIPLVDFTDLFYKEEWEEVLSATDKMHAFYNLWTKKEAFLKVIGSGLNVPLNQVVIVDKTIQWKEATWYLQEVPLHPTHICWVCSSHPIETITKHCMLL